MSDSQSNISVLVIRLYWLIGSGHSEILHLDDKQAEHLVLQYKHSGRPDNVPKDILRVIQGSLTAGISKVIIDLTNVAWLNSTGLGQLIEWKEAVEKREGMIVFANPVRDIIEKI